MIRKVLQCSHCVAYEGVIDQQIHVIQEQVADGAHAIRCGASSVAARVHRTPTLPMVGHQQDIIASCVTRHVNGPTCWTIEQLVLRVCSSRSVVLCSRLDPQLPSEIVHSIGCHDSDAPTSTSTATCEAPVASVCRYSSTAAKFATSVVVYSDPNGATCSAARQSTTAVISVSRNSAVQHKLISYDNADVSTACSTTVRVCGPSAGAVRVRGKCVAIDLIRASEASTSHPRVEAAVAQVHRAEALVEQH